MRLWAQAVSTAWWRPPHEGLSSKMILFTRRHLPDHLTPNLRGEMVTAACPSWFPPLIKPSVI